MSMLSIVAPIWNEIAACGLRTTWARERFTLEDGELILQAYEKEARKLEKQGIPNQVITAYLDLKPLLLERAAIAKYKETSSGWADNALPEVNSVNEAVILASQDRPLNRSQQQQLTKLLQQDLRSLPRSSNNA